ncbi:hypothetical protein P9139_15365 [Curtobacterium flaccumfaciens]|nr:hypothetical protein P9139_15365 [Curtobacterium flaccumfaciens]
MDDAVEVFGRYRLKAPPDFVAAARALAIFEGTLRTLAPSFDLLEESRGLAREQIRDQLRPGKLRDVAVRELFGAVSAARRLPRRVDRIGEAIETGKLLGQHQAVLRPTGPADAERGHPARAPGAARCRLGHPVDRVPGVARATVRGHLHRGRGRGARGAAVVLLGWAAIDAFRTRKHE